MKIIHPSPSSLCHPGASTPAAGGSQAPAAPSPLWNYPTACWKDFVSALCWEKLLLFRSNLPTILDEYLKWAPTFSLPPEKQGGKHMGNMQLGLQNNNEASGNFSRKRNESWGDILQNLEAYIGWRTVIQHVSKHTWSPSTAWGKIFGTFIVNSLANTAYGYSLPASRHRSQPCSHAASPGIRCAWKWREPGSWQSCRQNHPFLMASASRPNPSHATGLFPAGAIHLS